jgi:hypothetical protein
VRTPQPKEVQLVIAITRKRGWSQIIVFEKTAPQDPDFEPLNRANVIALALQLRAHLNADPTRFHDEIAQKFGTSRPQVSQYLKLIERLPKGFIDRMKACNDPKTLRRFSGRALLGIAKLHSMEEREQAIARLQSTP